MNVEGSTSGMPVENQVAGNETDITEVDYFTIRRYFQERVEKKEEELMKMEASVFQASNYNFVFQGVILTAIVSGSSTTSNLHHRHLILLFYVSLTGAILNLLILAITTIKYTIILGEVDKMKRKHYEIVYRKKKTAKSLLKQDIKKKKDRIPILVTYLLLFSAFAGFNLFVAHKIIDSH